MSAMGDSPDRLDDLRSKLREFVNERDWEQFHDPKNLAMCLASEVGELLSEYRWVTNADADTYSHQDAARRRISTEIGDVGIALLLLADRIGLDLIEVMSAKLAQNAEKYPASLARGRAEAPTMPRSSLPGRDKEFHDEA